jgi:recombination protein RecA
MLSVEARAVIARVNKAYGLDTLVVASDMVIPRRYTTGSIYLDRILGGGWPANQWAEILGKESAGKTVVTLKTIAANQAADPEYTALWVAGEHYNATWAQTLGVDNDRLTVCPTMDMEFALELMLQVTESRAFDCVVLDSYPALIPKQEAANAMDEFSVAEGAKVFNKYWRKAGKASKRNSNGTERPFHGIIINQQRDKIGWSPSGSPLQTSPGGHGKDYAYFVRLSLVRDEYLWDGTKDDKVFVGQTIKMTTTKNKAASPNQVASVDFYFRDTPTRGFRKGEYDSGKEYVSVGLDMGIIRKGGGWYYFADRKWQGKPAVFTDFHHEPELRAELRKEVMEMIERPGS